MVQASFQYHVAGSIFILIIMSVQALLPSLMTQEIPVIVSPETIV